MGKAKRSTGRDYPLSPTPEMPPLDNYVKLFSANNAAPTIDKFHNSTESFTAARNKRREEEAKSKKAVSDIDNVVKSIKTKTP